MSHPDHSESRRTLLKGGSAAVTAAFIGPLAAMATRVAEAACVPATASSLGVSPYGPLAPVNDQTTGLPILQLPSGFSYKSYGWRGDRMSDGLNTPTTHDGMGVVSSRRVGRSNEIILVRNHEQGNGANPANIIGASLASVAKYDTGITATGITGYQLGGTTNLVFRDGSFVESYASFGGTYRNCAGGSSAWGSWLTNEEIRTNTVSSTGKRHGYIFEVPADTSLTAANSNPIIDMGRMAHEACAIDPTTGYWYLTEDQGNANTLYRFLPDNVEGGLNSLHAGGTLQGLKVRNVMHADLRLPTLCHAVLRGGQRLGERPLHPGLWQRRRHLRCQRGLLGRGGRGVLHRQAGDHGTGARRSHLGARPRDEHPEGDLHQQRHPHRQLAGQPVRQPARRGRVQRGRRQHRPERRRTGGVPAPDGAAFGR
jgi:secreted PhoX family phosphatase